ncbi:hypothetical protein [Streptococcus dysgalactiae]|uniref:hypothetical protein n=1 Tax=Streptococcus dysgalactiae TaxID=1334 RepID=UPI001C4F2625|nr:hypothetical protein [Streptococcus dysgalactiae]
MDTQELLDNLQDELYNLEIRISKNVFKGETPSELKKFVADFLKICEQKEFDVTFELIESLPSHSLLLEQTPTASVDYVSTSIKSFYEDFIEPTKIELYG